LIKLLCFDLDGTLVSLKEAHFEALNKAINKVAGPKFIISKEEHYHEADGKTTKEKLKWLTRVKKLPLELQSSIWKKKQSLTLDFIHDNIKENIQLTQLFFRLKLEGFHIAVTSNSIMDTIDLVLANMGLNQFVDKVYSNEDVEFSKPNPQVYQKAMFDFGVAPHETLIFEDSPVGQQSGYLSGGYLYGVQNPDFLNYSDVKNFIDRLSNLPKVVPWFSHMNVVIPMAGEGSRFQKAGFNLPKPLIDVNGKPMIVRVIENLNICANFIFLVQKAHLEKFPIELVLRHIKPNCHVVVVDKLTEGAACTLLLAKRLINNNLPLLIANSDQIVEWDSPEFCYSLQETNADGGILTFKANHPKWSYAKTNAHGIVTEVAEKRPISENATVGIYWYKRGSDFVTYAERMIQKDIRVNGEFYICPIFNEFIQDDKTIKIRECKKMWGLGTPEDLKIYLENNRP
jgi:HAD superfamily hydrolase (TIGR01509 family)